MEKTLAFALNEALQIGRLSANVSYQELELKEKIIQELDAMRLPVNPLMYNRAISDAIIKIRGVK